jgi:hypothetical protein
MVGSDQNESKAKRKAHNIKKPMNPAMSSASDCMVAPVVAERSGSAL